MSSNLKNINADSDISTLASNLRRLMHDFSVDSSDLSKRTGIALTTINSLKRGIGNPTLSTLYQLADFFKISLSDLTESNLCLNSTQKAMVYEIPLLSTDELAAYINDRKRFKKTISTDLDSWKPDMCYAVKLTNNAMSPLFDKGSIFVLVHNTFVHDGDIVLVEFDRRPPCFRRIYIESDSYFYKPISEIIGDNTVSSNNAKIHGIVIKAIQHFHN